MSARAPRRKTITHEPTLAELMSETPEDTPTEPVLAQWQPREPAVSLAIHLAMSVYLWSHRDWPKKSALDLIPEWRRGIEDVAEQVEFHRSRKRARTFRSRATKYLQRIEAFEAELAAKVAAEAAKVATGGGKRKRKGDIALNEPRLRAAPEGHDGLNAAAELSKWLGKIADAIAQANGESIPDEFYHAMSARYSGGPMLFHKATPPPDATEDAAFAKTANPSPPRRKGGRPKIGVKQERERLQVIDDWHRARAAGTRMKDFCTEKSIDQKTLERYIVWKAQRKRRASNA
jgi:hypothetical protein